jgi:dihydroxy-acid dehydratase
MAWRAPSARPADRRGYRKLFLASVTQADRGCDLDFCVPEPTTRVPKNNSYRRGRQENQDL